MYGYTGGNPIGRVDIYGLEEQKPPVQDLKLMDREPDFNVSAEMNVVKLSVEMNVDMTKNDYTKKDASDIRSLSNVFNYQSQKTFDKVKNMIRGGRKSIGTGYKLTSNYYDYMLDKIESEEIMKTVKKGKRLGNVGTGLGVCSSLYEYSSAKTTTERVRAIYTSGLSWMGGTIGSRGGLFGSTVLSEGFGWAAGIHYDYTIYEAEGELDGRESYDPFAKIFAVIKMSRKLDRQQHKKEQVPPTDYPDWYIEFYKGINK